MLNIPQEKLTAIKNFAHQYIFKLLCQQDIPFILAHLDPQLIGIGAAEHNYYDTPQAAKDFILSLEGPVSYTHLDVYKRQHHVIILFLQRTVAQIKEKQDRAEKEK